MPAFLDYSFTGRTRLVARTGLFCLGLRTTLMPLGVAGPFADQLFYGHRDALLTAGGDGTSAPLPVLITDAAVAPEARLSGLGAAVSTG